MDPSYKDALCRAFCGDIFIRDVPVGFAVSTGFKRDDGDAIGFYVVYDTEDRSVARLEDDGMTIPTLEASGADVSDGPRAEAFVSLLSEYGVEHDESENVLHTPFMSIDKLAREAVRFVAFLLRIQDFMLVTRERVEETFKADVIRAVTERFSGRATVTTDDVISESLKDYPADVVIRPHQDLQRAPMALYIATSENKALEALVLRMQTQFVERIPCKVMMVLETAKPQRIKERTLARAMNSFPVAVFRGQEIPALEAIERQIFGEETRIH